jgi:exodeoxyribonuclease-3
MRILSWNVNGIRAVVRNGLGDWFNSKPADIICLQEVKATAEQGEAALFPPAYKYISWNDAQSRAGYSGVATLSAIAPIKTEKGFGIEEFDREGRILIHEFEHFFLYNIYFPNSQRGHDRLDYKLRFYDTFLAHAQENRKTGKAIMVCGDLNTAHNEIDLTHPKANKKTAGFLPEERAWMDKLVDNGFVDTFRIFNKEGGQYSWWTYRLNARERNIGWRLDYFFVNEEHQSLIKEAFILKEVMGSDHCPVGIDITF